MSTYIKSSLLSIALLLAVGAIRAAMPDTTSTKDLDKQISDTQKSINEVSRGIEVLSKDLEQLEQETDALAKRFKALQKECPLGKLSDGCPGRWVKWGADGVKLGAKTATQANKRVQEAKESETYAKLAAKKQQLEEARKKAASTKK